MASIYKKPLHILQAKLWDEKSSLSETYKLQSNDTCNKVQAEVHQDSGQFGIEFTVNWGWLLLDILWKPTTGNMEFPRRSMTAI